MAGIQEDLFELIQTLSIAEKRYFKVFSSSSKSTDIKYVILFDALCDLGYYDEQLLVGKLKRKFKNTPGKDPGAQLNQDMQYLYKVLLQAMRQYNHQTLLHIQIQDMTFEAIFLRDRGLYRQADKRISKAKEFAQKNHNYIARMELNRLERTLIWSLNEANEEEKTARLIAEKNHILEVLNEEMAYDDLYAIVSNAINRQNLFIANDERAALLVSKIAALFSQKEPDELSSFARLRRYQIGAQHTMAENRLKDSRDHIDKLLNWWETHDSLKEEEFFRYQISLSNLLAFFFNSGEFEEMMQLIRKIRESNSKTPYGNTLMFRFTVMYELLYYMNMGKLDEAVKMLPDIKEGVNKYPLSPKRKITIYYNAALVCFFDDNYKHCDEWLLKVIALSRSNLRKDLIRKAFLLRILLLEERTDDAQDKAIHAAKKYFKGEEESKEKGKSPPKEKLIEQEILALIIKIMHTAPGFREREEPVRKLLAYLENIISNPQSGRLHGLDEFIIWCQSILRRKSVRQIFNEGFPPGK